MSYGWEFPINAQGGQREGLNSHGMESFKDDKYYHLPREIIQNSLDAVKNDNEVVKVEFTNHRVNVKEIPDVETLKHIFYKLKSEEKDDKYHHFYENAHTLLGRDKINILKISDYGTRGLLGVNDASGDWAGLLLNSGSNYKPDGSGGTYGLGKNAPFLFSNLYSIIYSTKTNEDIPSEGLMGVSKLASHLNDNGEVTRGVGYYRNKINYEKPYLAKDILPELLNREESGTDILVLGFTTEEDWTDRLIKSVLKNFFVKILSGDLEVVVEDLRINKESLQELMEKYQRHSDFDVYDYYEAYVNESENSYQKELMIRDLGKIKLKVFLDGSENRKVLMTRNLGMTVTYLTRFSRMVNFTAVGTIEGEKLNDILSQCEPPAHNEWNEEFYRGALTKSEVRNLLLEMRRVVREYINSLEEITHTDEIELEGLNDILGWTDEADKLTHDLKDNKEGLNKVAQLKVKNKKKNKKENKILDPKGNKKSKSKESKKKGKRRNNRRIPQPNPESPTIKRASVHNIRVIGDYQSNKYTIFFTPKSSGSVRLSIKQEGMNGTKYTRMFQKINRLDSNEEINISDGITDEIQVNKNETVRLQLEMSKSRMSRLEVKTLEN